MDIVVTILFVGALVALIWATLMDLLPPALKINQLTPVAFAGLCVLLLAKIKGLI